MGHNATVVVMLDNLHTIAKDKMFGKKLSDAVSKAGCFTGTTVDVSATDGHCIACNAATVVEVHHADTKVLVAVGGNMGEVVSPYAGSYSADKEQMLRNFADQMGFSLRKKPKKKS